MLGAVVKKIAPARSLDTFRHRDDAKLPLDVGAVPSIPLLLDMMVYLDRSAGKLLRSILELIAARQHLVYHCGVVAAELAISIGMLDPADPQPPATIAAIQAHMDQISQSQRHMDLLLQIRPSHNLLLYRPT